MTPLRQASSSHAALPVEGATSAEELRQTFRRYVTGVTVVTTLTDDGKIVGMTANSFTSVSLDPPLILVCLNLASRSFDTFLRAGRMAVHILADDQSEIARAFAQRGADRDMICPWRPNARGYAILDRYFAVLECRIADVHRAGDHGIVVARVEALDGPSTADTPLVYHNGRMFGLATSDSVASDGSRPHGDADAPLPSAVAI